MILVDMEHSQPHMTLYNEVIYLSSYGIIFHEFESMMMILLYASIASLSTTSSGGLTILLWGSRTETCNTNFGIYLFFGVAINIERQ